MAEPARRRFTRYYALAAIVALGAAGWYFFIHDGDRDRPADSTAEPDPPPDPRLTFDSPFRNVRPAVQYVGDAACAGCHADIDKAYHAHPMGRSAEVVAKATPIERYDAAAHNPSPVGPYELFVERAGDRVFHHVRAKDASGRPLPDYVVSADLAVGSGTRGRSYLTVEDGGVWQTPISWYGPDARWDLSPGFDLGNGGRRGIVPDCLYCHVNQVDPVPLAANRYRRPFPTGQPAIGCERCHGPGELHVAERAAGPAGDRIDTSIVNPKHLSAGLRAGICAQCHLQGEARVARRGRSIFEYRPGLPVEQFLTVFVRHPDLADYQKSVGQFEQMHQSRCFTESNGRLGCTSCHDPHGVPPPADKDRFFNGRCQNCHGGGESPACSERPAARQARADNCVGCHMPRADSSNIVHASVTDHRVPRRPIPAAHPPGLRPGELPVAAFPVSPHGPPAAELDRDTGIALSEVITHVGSNPVARRMVASMAEDRLVPSLARWPGDALAWRALTLAREARGDSAGLLEAATAAAALAPESEVMQSDLATAAAAAGRLDVALTAATEAVRLSPAGVDPLLLRAGIYLQQRDWGRAEADCRAALAIHPLHPRARLLLAVCRHHRGDPAGAARERDTALHLATKPDQRAALLGLYRSWAR